ncbi:transposase [Clostridium sp. DL1XJH146]
MARKKLIWYPGATYHIMTRGNHRNYIFKDREDYLVYLNTLEEALKKYSGILYCYCLMTNHVHLVIETSEINISTIMKRINQLFTLYFNNKYNLVGHLFQGRYYWELIEEDRYVLEVSRYIHLNPVRANMVSKPEEYKWSSYSMFIEQKKEKLIKPKKVLSYFQEENQKELYRKFVESGIKTKLNIVCE